MLRTVATQMPRISRAIAGGPSADGAIDRREHAADQSPRRAALLTLNRRSLDMRRARLHPRLRCANGTAEAQARDDEPHVVNDPFTSSYHFMGPKMSWLAIPKKS